jgi:hypothetical protein
MQHSIQEIFDGNFNANKLFIVLVGLNKAAVKAIKLSIEQ